MNRLQEVVNRLQVKERILDCLCWISKLFPSILAMIALLNGRVDYAILVLVFAIYLKVT